MSEAAFLDHAAGSPLRAEVAEAMASSMAGLPPNPSGSHQLARRTRAVLEDARDRVAAELGAPPRAVVFCSGGTESCNLALRARSERVLRSSVEHAAVREASPGAIELRVDAAGLLEVEAAADVIQAGDLVSVMAANNETGAVQPLEALVEALGDRRGSVLLHSDAVAAAACVELGDLVERCDLVSIAAHKLGGPLGAGALVVGAGVELEPLLKGGGQERGRRAGTENVAGAVGLAAALELVAAERRAGSVDEMAARRNRLEEALLAVEGVSLSSADAPRLSSHCHVTVEGLRSEELLVLLDSAGVCASAGAACASGAPRPSHVLLAMGRDRAGARSGLRFSLATTTSDEEVDRAAMAVVAAIRQLRS